MIDLSIVIVNWNTKDFLLQCLESICQTVRRGSWEILMIDNGSSDGSGEAAKKSFPSIQLIENGINLGFAKAVNQGLQQSSGRNILLLNPDVRLKGGAIERVLYFMETHSEVGVSGGQLLNEDGSKQNSIANFPSLATELLNKSLLKRMLPKRFPGKGRNYSEPIEVDSVIGACMMVRREAMEQVGLLDEDYFLFLEETDWCYRMKRAGWKVYHLPEVEIYHFQGKSAEVEKKRAKVEYYRSRYHFFKKHRGKLRELFLHIGLVTKLIITLIFTTLICLLTFFTVKRWRGKLSISAYLFWWHMRLCPAEMGLRSKISNS